jgi:hypothetical protein
MAMIYEAVPSAVTAPRGVPIRSRPLTRSPSLLQRLGAALSPRRDFAVFLVSLPGEPDTLRGYHVRPVRQGAAAFVIFFDHLGRLEILEEAGDLVAARAYRATIIP